MSNQVRIVAASTVALFLTLVGLIVAGPSSAATVTGPARAAIAVQDAPLRPADAASCTTSGKMCIFVNGSGLHVTHVGGGVAPSGGLVNGQKWCGTVYYGVNNSIVAHSPHACATVTSPYYYDFHIDQYYANGTKLCVGQYTDSGYYNPGGGACATVSR